MAAIEYTTPGVYIEEIPSGARPIQAVGTRTAGFVGSAPNPLCYLNEAIAVNNWAEFVKRFMTPTPEEVAKLEQSRQALKEAKAALDSLKRGVPEAGMEAEADARINKALQALKEAKDALDLLEKDALETKRQEVQAKVAKAKERVIEEALARDVGKDNDALQALKDAEKELALLDTGALETKRREALAKVAKAKEGVIHIKEAQTEEVARENQALQALKEANDALNSLAKDAPAATREEAQARVARSKEEVIKAVLMEDAAKAARSRDEVIQDAQARVAGAEEDAKQAQAALVYPSTHLSDAVYGFFLNGGNRCYIVNVGKNEDGSNPPISGGASGIPVGLDIMEQVDEVAIVAAPGYTDPASYTAIRDHCDKLKDRVGILDGPEKLDDAAMKQLAGEDVQNATWTMPTPSDHGQLTLYVPWIEISDPNTRATNGSGTNGSRAKGKLVPPSGHIAGIWARSDATRGVHKAPANEPVRGAIRLEKQITHEEQGGLNYHGVNVIRYFTSEGFLVWGARTLTTDDSFRYLNVRRLFNMIEESILESTRWIVFEPNDRPLWQAIRRDVTAFLMGFWRDGALKGRTPDEAFYVKCDEETNPIESIREGKVIIEVGLAPVRPAEFVIFRISQYEPGTEVEAQAA